MKILVFLILSLTNLVAFAGNETSHLLECVGKNGDVIKIRAFTYKNNWDKDEVRLEATGIPVIKGINPVIGFGRDLDDDGKIETWFMYNTKQGVTIHQLATNHRFGFDGVKNQLFKEYATSVDMYVNVTTIVLASYMSMAASNLYTTQLEHYQELFDIYEINHRLERSQAMDGKTLNPQQVKLVSILLQEGIRRTEEKLKKAEGKQFYTLVAVDVGIWLASAKITEYLGRGARYVGKALLKTTEGVFFLDLLKKWIAQKGAFLAKMALKAKSLAGAAISGTTNAIVRNTSQKIFKNTLSQVARAMVAKSAIMNSVKAALVSTNTKLIAWNPNWKMTIIKTSASVSANMLMASEEKSTSDIINQLMKDQDTKVKVLSSATAKNGTRLEGQVVGMADLRDKSITFFGDKKSRERIVQASWKVGPLNYIEMVDEHALNFIEQATIQSNDKNLKLIGYMIVVVNEFGMNKVKDNVNQKVNQTVLVPITIPAA